MTYQIPKQIKAGPYVYAVKRASVELSHDGRVAETSHVSLEMRFAPSSVGSHLPVSLMHEIINVCNWLAEVGLKEKQVTQLGHALTAILQDLDLYPREMTLE